MLCLYRKLLIMNGEAYSFSFLDPYDILLYIIIHIYHLRGKSNACDCPIIIHLKLEYHYLSPFFIDISINYVSPI